MLKRNHYHWRRNWFSGLFVFSTTVYMTGWVKKLGIKVPFFFIIADFFFFFLRGKWCNLLLVFSFINNLGPKNVFWKNEKIIGSNYGKMVGMASIHIDLHKTAISRHSKKAYAKVSLLLQTSQKMVENVSLSHVSSSLSLPTEITRSREAGRLQFNDHILVEY